MAANKYYSEDELVEKIQSGEYSWLDYVNHHSEEWQNEYQAWCLENGIKPSTYYCHLRKAREAVLESNQIVAINPMKPDAPESYKTQTRVPSTGIRIESGGITVTLPENVSAELLYTALTVLNHQC